MTIRSSQSALNMLTEAVWKSDGNEGSCPLEKYPTFRQLDNLITTTAWGLEARDEFARRWHTVEQTTHKTFEVGSFAELAHLVWEEATVTDPQGQASARAPDHSMAVRTAGGPSCQRPGRYPSSRHDCPSDCDAGQWQP